jgi:outer membrane protein assembly factor BamB
MKKSDPVVRLVWFLCFSIGNVATQSMRADDWPQWGGPQRDLVWREDGIVEELPAELARVWSAPIGAGYAGPSVAGGRVFVADRIEADGLERVLAVDAETGREIWRHAYAVDYTISYPLGPRATPTVDEDRVYALGAMGDLFCLNAATGEVVWQKNLPRDFNTQLPTWGMAAAPLVDGDQLIVLAGGRPDALVVSLDKRTGNELWRALEDEQVGYCPPLIFNFGGQSQLIIWHPAAVSAIDPQDGRLLWEVPFDVQAGLTIPTPRKLGSRLFVTAFYNGPVMIELGADGMSPQVLWRSAAGNNEIKNDSLHAIMCTPIVRDDFVFGVGSYGELRCLDTQNGNVVWETRDATGEGRWWNAFLIEHKDRVFLANEQGELIVARLDGEGYHEFSRAKLIEPTQPIQRRMTVWSHPAFAMKSVFARNDRELVRVSLATGRE